MARNDRPQHHLDLGQIPLLIPPQTHSASSTAASSPVEGPSANNRTQAAKLGTIGSANALGAVRHHSGSPSLEHGSRFYPRRSREHHTQTTGTTTHPWGPPTASGLSTPLRETIPESPGDDTFPNLGTSPPLDSATAAVRRARAGTVPSRFPAGTFGPTPLNTVQKSSRATPSASPFRSGTATPADLGAEVPGSSAFLSRIRAGSMPQRASLMSSSSSPFGPSVFSSSWNNGRGRASTLSAQLDDPSSPPRGSFRKDSLIDTDIRTLDYLGLVDPSPQSATADPGAFDPFMIHAQEANLRPLLSNDALTRLSNNRFRSYSVNAKEKYGSGDEPLGSPSPYYSGTITPSAEAAAQALAVTQAQIHQHNLDVQAFAHQASSSRPRARTAGLLDSPSLRFWRTFAPSPSRLDNSVVVSDLEFDHTGSYEIPNDEAQAMQVSQPTVQASNGALGVDQVAGDDVSRALWIGNVPPSTTSHAVKLPFEVYGTIDSARVLTHKGCAFINFNSIESAALAKAQLDGKEIFPGGGPVRIGYAKVPNATPTPIADGFSGARSPPPLGEADAHTVPGSLVGTMAALNFQEDAAPPPEGVPLLEDIQEDILAIIREFGASHDEQSRIAASVHNAVRFDVFEQEIPPVPEPIHNRIHDAPRLREIRKRIDNNTCTQGEIEEIAIGMLPEIAELSSDYLGNTVVQKLFEFCSEPVKEAMLQQISPHIAEIGIHKNGTWAVQKIIDVAHTPMQMSMIVEGIRPYGPATFLDQYGNYVIQCCLRFQAPWNNFIFEIMLSRLWEIAQGRFGARAMRATLESHFATKEQQKMLAAAIAISAVPLATNTNGALLLTWYLDTCTVPNRRKVLAPRLISHIVHLATHKVAYLTILKIVNQRNEPEARDAILNAIFFSQDEAVLEDILRDQACGATLAFKVLTTPFFDDKVRTEVVQKVRNALLAIKAQPSQGYKRLMDEVNLTTRGAGGSGHQRESSRGGRDKSDGSRPTSKHGANPSSGYNSSAQPGNGQFLNVQQGYMPLNSGVGAQYQHNGSTSASIPQHQQGEQYATYAINGVGNISEPANHHLSQIQFQQGQRLPTAVYNYPGMQSYPTQGPHLMRNGGMPFAMGSPAMMAQPGFHPAHPSQTGYVQMMPGVPGAGIWPQYPAGPYMVPQGMGGRGRGRG